MEKAIRSALMQDIFLTSIKTDKFKSGILSVNLLRPLSEEEASMNALIPSVLRRGSEDHPDLVTIAAALDELYGASIGAVVRKRGEVQAIGLTAEFNDDAYIPGSEKLLEAVCALTGELLLRPVSSGGAFDPDYFESEKKNLLDAIAARVNDKISYTQSKLVSAMCAGEAYGTDKLGSRESAEKITNAKLYAHYRDMLATSRFEIIYVGSAGHARVADAMIKALALLPRGGSTPTSTVIPYAVGEAKYLDEAMDIAQGKLSMGFRTGTTANDEDYPAMALFNAIYGGSLNSKLFMNVREKLSLCYYASSGLEKFKGLLIVNSGIEFDKFETARDEILAQLEACKRGEISGDELESSRKYLLSGLSTIGDSLNQMEEYRLGQIIGEFDYTPEELAAEIKKLTLADVVNAAKKIRLDTVYFLKGAQK